MPYQRIFVSLTGNTVILLTITNTIIVTDEILFNDNIL